MPFYPLQTPKIKILKNEKNCWRYHHFTHLYQKSQSFDVWFLRCGAWQTEFFVIMDHFLPFYPYGYRKSKFWKNEKNAWRYHFTNVYHKWQSYDIWFVTSGVQQSKFFVIFDLLALLPLPPAPLLRLPNPTPTPEIWCVTDVTIFHFGPFFTLLPP